MSLPMRRCQPPVVPRTPDPPHNTTSTRPLKWAKLTVLCLLLAPKASATRRRPVARAFSPVVKLKGEAAPHRHLQVDPAEKDVMTVPADKEDAKAVSAAPTLAPTLAPTRPPTHRPTASPTARPTTSAPVASTPIVPEITGSPEPASNGSSTSVQGTMTLAFSLFFPQSGTSAAQLSNERSRTRQGVLEAVTKSLCANTDLQLRGSESNDACNNYSPTRKWRRVEEADDASNISVISTDPVVNVEDATGTAGNVATSWTTWQLQYRVLRIGDTYYDEAMQNDASLSGDALLQGALDAMQQVAQLALNVDMMEDKAFDNVLAASVSNVWIVSSPVGRETETFANVEQPNVHDFAPQMWNTLRLTGICMLIVTVVAYAALTWLAGKRRQRIKAAYNNESLMHSVGPFGSANGVDQFLARTHRSVQMLSPIASSLDNESHRQRSASIASQSSASINHELAASEKSSSRQASTVAPRVDVPPRLLGGSNSLDSDEQPEELTDPAHLFSSTLDGLAANAAVLLAGTPPRHPNSTDAYPSPDNMRTNGPNRAAVPSTPGSQSSPSARSMSNLDTSLTEGVTSVDSGFTGFGGLAGLFGLEAKEEKVARGGAKFID